MSGTLVVTLIKNIFIDILLATLKQAFESRDSDSKSEQEASLNRIYETPLET